MSLPRLPGGTPKPSHTFGRDSRPLPDIQESLTNIREGLTDIREGLTTPPYLKEGLLTFPGLSKRPPDPSQTSGRALLPFLDFQWGLPTLPGHSEEPPNPSQTFGRAFRPFPDFQ